jgi:uncharacterized protein (TIGR03086 family)
MDAATFPEHSRSEPKDRKDGGAMDVVTQYRIAVQSWTDRLDAVTTDRLDDPTPCEGWSVRDLVNHVVGEELWTPPLMAGQTIEQVGGQFDGDLLGDDPLAAARAAAAVGLAAVDNGLDGRKVHLSYGDEDAEEYVRQLVADHLIHGWDLSAALGADTRLDPGVVDEVAIWFGDREEMYRSAGVVGPREEATGDPQSDLLAASGRRSDWNLNVLALERFGAAFGSGDIDATMAMCTDDVVFESTSPAPDGGRHGGAAAVREVWARLFRETGGMSFTEEESFVTGDRAVQRWSFAWTGDDGSPGHVRGVDVMRFRDGRVCEKFSYVKG